MSKIDQKAIIIIRNYASSNHKQTTVAINNADLSPSTQPNALNDQFSEFSQHFDHRNTTGRLELD